MTNPLSRRGYNHPSQSSAGDATLYSNIETIYSSIGNDLMSRWGVISSLANGASASFIHGLRLPFPLLKFVAYTSSSATDDGTGELTIKLGSLVTYAPDGTNPTTTVTVTNNSGGTLTNLRILAKQDIDSSSQKFVDPSITAGGNVYAKLADAIAAASAGDTITVRGTETVTTAITQSVADLTIMWAPLAKTVAGGSITSILNITGARCRLVAPYLRVDNTTVTYPLKVAAADCRVMDGIIETNAAVTLTAAVQINSGGNRAKVDLGILVTTGTVTSDFEDNVGTLRGSFAR